MSIDSKFLEFLTAKLLPREDLSHGRSNELSEAASKLLPRQGWRQKFSEKYIRFRLEKEVLNDLPEDDPASQISERLTKFISDLDDFSSECTVYLPVEGLKLSKRLKLGNVQFIPVTKTFKRNLLRQGKERIFRTSHPALSRWACVVHVQTPISELMMDAKASPQGTVHKAMEST